MLEENKIQSSPEEKTINLLRKGHDGMDIDDLLLMATAEQLRESIEQQVESPNPSQSLFIDIKAYLKICKALDDEGSALLIVKKTAEKYLANYDGITQDEFAPHQRQFIGNLVAIIQYFNEKFPGFVDTIKLLAEAQHLYAQFNKWYFDPKIDRLDETGQPEERIYELIKIVNQKYLEAIDTAMLSAAVEESSDPEVFAIWETVVTKYCQWLLDVGEDEKTVKEFCEEVYARNPQTNIYYNLDLPDPREQRLRRRAHKRHYPNTDKVMTFGQLEAKIDALDLQARMAFEDGAVLEGFEYIERIAEIDPEFARQTSRAVSGGYNVIKDPLMRVRRGYTHNN